MIFFGDKTESNDMNQFNQYQQFTENMDAYWHLFLFLNIILPANELSLCSGGVFCLTSIQILNFVTYYLMSKHKVPSNEVP